MSDQTTTYDDGDEDDLLAAEYVLGVLDADQRAMLERRLLDDREFGRLVARWQADLAPFDSAYSEVDPPAGMLAAIEAQLFDSTPSPRLIERFWGRVGFWRSLALASLAALLIGTVLVLNQRTPGGPTLVTTIAASQSDVSFVALYDSKAERLRVRRTTGGSAASDRSYELWVIPEGQSPVSLGVLAEAGTDRAIRRDLAALIVEGATLAVTLEPFGGSASGAPTGPVVAAGPVMRL